MKRENIAAQLYTTRDLCRTPEGLAATLRHLQAIGYKAVQVSGIGPIPYRQVKEMLAEQGLVCCATHEGSEELLENPETVAGRLAELGCNETAYAWPAGQDFSRREGVVRLAKALNRTGRVLAEAGIAFSYHNHAIELHRPGKASALETLVLETDPKLVRFELDTYWLQAGGANPLEWFAKLKGRMSLVHLKDYGVNPQGKPVFEEVGSGNLPIPAIVKEAERAGCRWFIVEQDSDWEDGDPLSSLATSFRFLAGLARGGPAGAAARRPALGKGRRRD